nr:hypothetical protein B0A51_01514 [Rachicladosporium sp. CCFEE 5018]
MPDSANSKPVLNTHAEGEHPPHSLPGSTAPATQGADKASTASHPHTSKPDPTTGGENGILHPSDGKAPGATREELLSGKKSTQDAEGGLPTASATGASQQPSSEKPQLPALVRILRSNLRQYPNFPQPGILFEDILPLFASPKLFETLLTALELLITSHLGKDPRIDIVVGLESRGFLFGPALALRLGAGFVPVRKPGKLPGKVKSVGFQKEYGGDSFEMQADAVKSGQRVLIADDIIATGGSAAAAGDLVRQLGGELVGYVFMMELEFLKGRDKLDADVFTLFSGQEEGLESMAKDSESKETEQDREQKRVKMSGNKAEEVEFPMGMTKEPAGTVKTVTDTGGSLAEGRP